MTFVVDASIAAAWLLPDEQSAEADEVLHLLASEGAQAPSLLWYELRNILVMATRRGRLAASDAVPALARLRRLPIETVDMTLTGDADVIQLADRYRLTAYDAAYLVLARGLPAPLATADQALARAAKQEAVRLLISARGA